MISFYKNRYLIYNFAFQNLQIISAIGEDYSVEPAERRRPFCALLDVGLLCTTTGNHIFGALSQLLDLLWFTTSNHYSSVKGALDGGLDIPHSDKRFAGYKKGESTFSVGMLAPTRGCHDKFQTHFAKYAMINVEADGLEDFYKVHAAIRADPTATKTEKEAHKRIDHSDLPESKKLTCTHH
ncbi:hypothetical protein MKW94_029958 [Papaver nudicaule]|uniref:Large ribosomal subunit protein uL18 C-terminal eukaryotes domain-containing protein n=1 Tax=Papaver nudicaule TaxID=74823 RepID=A0AA42B3V3_PAPNU|nr:hypothetical protein [Papaver nudicaule]